MKVHPQRSHVKGPASTPPAPARIWGLLASEADRVVLFRRAPTRWTRVYLCDTVTDTLTSGSWFQGRLYEWMSDLSPDGEHLLYTARNESPQQQALAMERYGVRMWSWTALSKPPHVHAIGLWNASDGWSGGGAFRDSRTILVNHTDLTKQQLIRPPGFTVVPTQGNERADTVRHALRRTGWRVTHEPERWIGMGEAHPFTLRKGSLELNFICDQRYRRFVRYR